MVKTPKTKDQYYLHDHLGSTVVMFHDKDNNGIVTTETDQPDDHEILDRSLYYPFGLPMHTPWDDQSDPEHRYYYNGKELHRTGLKDWQDYGARAYDPAVGRFTGVDPLADQRSWVSPYNYVQNNPINRIDPTGALDDPIHDSKTGEFLGHYGDSDFDGEIMLMDRETYMDITSGEDVVISPTLAEENGTYLSKIFSGKKMPNMSDLKLLSNVYTSLLKEAGNQGLIDFDPSRLKNGVIGVSGADEYTYPAGYNYSGALANTGPIEIDGRFKVRANIQYYKNGLYVGPHIKYMTHAGNAISILGVHEYGLHGVAGLQGNHNHSKIYPIQWEKSKNYISREYKSLLKKRAGL